MLEVVCGASVPIPPKHGLGHPYNLITPKKRALCFLKKSPMFPYFLIDLAHTIDDEIPTWDEKPGCIATVTLDYARASEYS